MSASLGEAQGQQSGVRVLTTRVNFSKSFEPVVLKWGCFGHPPAHHWTLSGDSFGRHRWELGATGHQRPGKRHDAQKCSAHWRIFWVKSLRALKNYPGQMSISAEVNPSQLHFPHRGMRFEGCEGVRTGVCEAQMAVTSAPPTPDPPATETLHPNKQAKQKRKEIETNMGWFHWFHPLSTHLVVPQNDLSGGRRSERAGALWGSRVRLPLRASPLALGGRSSWL